MGLHGWTTYNGEQETLPTEGWGIYVELPGSDGAFRINAPDKSNTPPFGTRWMYCDRGNHKEGMPS